MAPHKTITINGRIYDAVTGLPVEAAASTEAPKATTSPKPAAAAPVKAAPQPAAAPRTQRPTATPRPDVMRAPKPKSATPAKPASKGNLVPTTPRSQTTSESVHSNVQRSQTLNRRATKKPTVPNRPQTKRPVVGKQLDVAKSASVSRFAKHPAVAPVAKTAPAAPVKPDAPAQVHPVAQRALHRSLAKKKAPAPAAAKAKTAKEVKDEAISKALAAPKPKAPKRKKANKQRMRRIIIASAIVFVIVAGLAAAWKLIPTISVSVASAQAGIQASYPEFTPDGYGLSQPVKFSDGEVILKFDSHSNDNYYTITQTRSSWDSSAVLDKVVTPAAGADYVTTRERGLTIYTYESAAVWVNGGILYKIDSKAPLSGDQIRRIATSL